MLSLNVLVFVLWGYCCENIDILWIGLIVIIGFDFGV